MAHGVDMHVGDMASNDLAQVDQASPGDMAGAPDLYQAPFSAPTIYPSSNGPNGVAVGKFNADTNNDIVAVSFDSAASTGALDYYAGVGDGTFAMKVTTALAVGPSSVAVGDVNGDNKLDVVFAAFDTNVYEMLGDGAGGFGAPTALSTGAGTITAARLADIDGDMNLDIVASDFGNFAGNGFVWVLLGNGDGTFPTAKQTSFSASNNTDATAWRLADNLRVGQLDNDAGNLPDVAVMNLTTSMADNHGTFSVLLNTSTPGNVVLTLSAELATGNSPSDILIAPIPSQHAAIAVANLGDDNAGVYFSNTTTAGMVGYSAPTTFAAFANSGSMSNPSCLAYADFDHDGFSDLAVAGGTGGGYVTIVYGGANGMFNVAGAHGRMGTEVVPVGNGPSAMTTGLFDSNTSVDLVVTEGASNDVAVLINKR